MNYCKIDPYDVANGEGVRVSLWVSGCTHHCKGCFNQETWDFNAGREFTTDTMGEILDMVAKPYVSGLSILGGDPLCQDMEGLMTLHYLIANVHRIGKTVWLWTGDTWEDIQKNSSKYELATKCDIVIDGQFDETKRDISLPYCGSSNQKVINVQKTLKKGEIVLWDI